MIRILFILGCLAFAAIAVWHAAVTNETDDHE